MIGSHVRVELMLIDLWLFASFPLPCMFLIYWAGHRWSGSTWATRSLTGWLALWSSCGLLTLPVLPVLGWVTHIEALGGIAALPWRHTFPLLRLSSESGQLIVPGMLAVMAIGNAAIYCGLAAFAWWLFQRTSKKLQANGKLSSIESCGLGILVSACLFGIANGLNFLRPITSDFGYPYGRPFTFFQDGGSWASPRFVLSGVFGDFLVVLLFGIALGWVLKSRPQHRTSGPSSTRL